MGMVLLDETEASRRRRAIYQALIRYLPETKVINALQTWERSFADGPAFALRGFVDQICNTEALRELRSAIHRSLVHCMSLELRDLGPEPRPPARATTQAAVPADTPTSTNGAAPPPVATAIFACLVGAFLDDLSRISPEYNIKIRGHLLDRLRPMGQSPAAGNQLIRWLTQKNAPLTVAIPTADMRDLLHFAYVMACEYYGPTVADKALSAAVKTAESLPQARHFPPRTLL